MEKIDNIFGENVFNDQKMRERLPKDIYQALKKTISTGKHLELDVANVVASAMKDWAIEKGVTHFTHWFQPMTGITAEKHDSFIEPTSDGKIIMEFSGKALVKGEPDASSFPSGGLRATFEARGYTAWDPSSYAFIKDDTLCIPTAFCSYSGDALDKKTPLLRSMEAVDKASLRILKLFGNNKSERVISSVGPEQEYFLIDKSVYLKRLDLIHTGRTLFGARPSKGQEMEDHYFGVIKPRVKAFMKELDLELWKLGVLAKTEHNEVAPAQHELAPIYTTTNIATDHNQIMMELMKTIANRHNLVCLLHEKPFAGINGSGKHNNWSLTTDDGINLLEPGKTPYENAQFLLVLCAIIKAVDENQDLLRISVASAGNDHRLGAHEAPPAIVSMFLGDELTEILDSIENDSLYNSKQKVQMEIGAHVLPHFPKDTTDRNRTSPFAFTGNKFEFRMLGSSISISGPNIVLNTITAQSFNDIADILEKSKDFKSDLTKIIKSIIKDHKRIVFNGNGYDESWVKEAEKRGLLNLKSTPDALPLFISEKNINLFTSNNVFSKREMQSRYEILLDNYSKTINFEALTLIDIANKNIIPSCLSYENELSQLVINKKSLGINSINSLDEKLLTKISTLTDQLSIRLESLSENTIKAKKITDLLEQAKYYQSTVLQDMSLVRMSIDELELIVSKKHWSLPDYEDIIYSVN